MWGNSQRFSLQKLSTGFRRPRDRSPNLATCGWALQCCEEIEGSPSNLALRYLVSAVVNAIAAAATASVAATIVAPHVARLEQREAHVAHAQCVLGTSYSLHCSIALMSRKMSPVGRTTQPSPIHERILFRHVRLHTHVQYSYGQLAARLSTAKVMSPPTFARFRECACFHCRLVHASPHPSYASHRAGL